MPSDDRFSDFDFEEYKRGSRFWDKIEMLCSAVQLEIDKSQGLFQKIGDMQRWRNLVTHASPYDIPRTIIAETVEAPRKLHEPFENKQYPRMANLEVAKAFHLTAYDHIQLIKTSPGIDPRATVSYEVG